jgi:hypothetical protein
VLLDPVRALRVFGLQAGGSFSQKVLYIYRKQLEEADLIVISKSELLPVDQLEALRVAVSNEFPHALVLTASVRTGANLEDWFSRIESGEQEERQPMDVDYTVYAEGEALLGWLNATAALSIDGEFEANLLLQTLAAEIQRKLETATAEIAHLKMTYSPDGGLGDIAVVNLVRNDYVPELAIRLEQPASGGQLVINLRAEANPDELAEALRSALPAAAASVPGLQITLEHMEFFKPGKPVPTHRVTEISS